MSVKFLPTLMVYILAILRVVKNAQKLDIIDFPSMEAMASRKGAKVLHLPSVQYAWKNNVPLRVLSTFELQ